MARSAGIVGVGAYLPEKVLNNFDLEKMVDTSDEWIKTRTGMWERHIAAEGEASSDLAFAAAQAALEMSGLDPMKLDAVILATVTPDYMFPATACLLQDRLGARNAGGFDLSAGCAGFASGLSVADAYIRAGILDNVLVVGVEMLTRIVNWEDRDTCVLFGDGAGAVVVSPVADGEGILAHFIKADGGGGMHLYQPGGGSRNPATHETVDKKMHYIHMSGQDVFKGAVRAMVEGAQAVLARAGYTEEDVDLLVPHQANLRIIEAVRKRLDIPPERAFVNIQRQANTSAATLPVCFEEAYRTGRLKKGDLVCTTTFGAGFAWAANLLRWYI